jgi:hypothetical protein
MATATVFFLVLSSGLIDTTYQQKQPDIVCGQFIETDIQ